jgi:hypothetical protein
MTTNDSQREIFTRLLPELDRMALAHFRGLDPEAKEEAVQNTRALAWKYWLRLIQQGRAEGEGLLRNVWWYCVKQTRVGRTITRGDGHRGKGRQDVYDQPDAVVLDRLDMNFYISDTNPIPDIVAFRMDLPRFLGTLTGRQREMAMDLASGERTAEVARKYGVTPGAVSQFRTRFKTLLERFQAA